MTRRPTFPHKKRGDHLSADHVNKLGEEIGLLARRSTGSHINSYNGHLTASHHPLVVRILEVTETAEGELPKGKPRYYDPNTSAVPEWLTDHSNFGLSLDPEAVGSTLTVGDIFASYWDTQRGAWIPLASPPGVGIGQANQDLSPGEAGSITLARWSGPVFIADGNVLQMRNTSGITIESGKKCSWEVHPGTGEHLCSPLEC